MSTGYTTRSRTLCGIVWVGDRRCPFIIPFPCPLLIGGGRGRGNKGSLLVHVRPCIEHSKVVRHGTGVPRSPIAARALRPRERGIGVRLVAHPVLSRHR